MINWNDTLKREYQNLFDTCKIHQDKVALADSIAQKIASHREQYRSIAQQVNKDMPWWLVGVIHHMECGLSFGKHLHNGDSLAHRTVRVPVGRPAKGNPPFTFEESALDALRGEGFGTMQDWSVAHVLFRLEGYNGYGYRLYHPTVKSPYLWAGTYHYTKGKYVADGKFKADAVSEQLGIAAIVKRGFELRLFE